jgi:hypothetical protein
MDTRAAAIEVAFPSRHEWWNGEITALRTVDPPGRTIKRSSIELQI